MLWEAQKTVSTPQCTLLPCWAEPNSQGADLLGGSQKYLIVIPSHCGGGLAFQVTGCCPCCPVKVCRAGEKYFLLGIPPTMLLQPNLSADLEATACLAFLDPNVGDWG